MVTCRDPGGEKSLKIKSGLKEEDQPILQVEMSDGNNLSNAQELREDAQEQPLNPDGDLRSGGTERTGWRVTLTNPVSGCSSLKTQVFQLRGWKLFFAVGLPALWVIAIIIYAAVVSMPYETTTQIPSSESALTTCPPCIVCTGEPVIKTTSSKPPILTQTNLCINCTNEPVSETTSNTAITLQKNGFEQGPLVDLGDDSQPPPWEDVVQRLPQLSSWGVSGVFLPAHLTSNHCLFDVELCRNISRVAAEQNISVIVDLNCDYMKTSHEWFINSENRTEGFTDLFVWVNAKNRNPPNNWRSGNEAVWKWSNVRQQYYLGVHGNDTAQLNLENEDALSRIAKHFRALLNAGAAGVRLMDVRPLGMNASAVDENSLEESISWFQLNNTLSLWKTEMKKNNETALLMVGNDRVELNEALWRLVDLPRRVIKEWEENDILPKLAPDQIKSQYQSALQVAETISLMEEAWIVALLSPSIPIFTWNQVNVMDGNEKGWRRSMYDEALALRKQLNRYEYAVDKIFDGIIFARWSGEHGYVVVLKTVNDIMFDLKNLNMPINPQQFSVRMLTNNYPTWDEKAITVNSTVSNSNIYRAEQCALVLSF